MTRFYKFIICLNFLCSSFIVNGKTFFVSTHGKNTNNGSYHFPFRTISFQIKKLNGGDTCYLFGGRYSENIEITTKFSQKTVISSFQNENVILCPPRKQIKWEYYQRGIYRSTIKNRVQNLYLRDKPLQVATFPSVDFYSFDRNKWLSIFAHTNKLITPLEQCKYNLDSSYIIAKCGRGLVSFSGQIYKINCDRYKINNQAFYWGDQYKSIYLGQGKGVFYGKLEFLDKTGEWFQKDETLYFFPNKKSDLQKIRYRTIYSQLLIKGSNIEFNKIKFIGYKIKFSDAKRCKLTNCIIEYPSPFFKFNTGYDHQKDYSSTKNEEYNGSGIELYGELNSIVNSKISSSLGDGISLKGRFNLVHNNIIDNCNFFGIDAFGVNLSGFKQRVTWNVIKNTGRSCILLSQVKNCLISKNQIFNGGLLCDDLGLIYTYGQSGYQTTISYNWLHSNKAKYFGAGIYLDNNHSNFNVKNNVIWNCYVAMCINQKAANDSILNNTFFNNKYSMASFIPDGLPPVMENIVTMNNITDSDLKSRDCQMFYGSKMSNNHYDKSLTKKFNNIFLGDFSLDSNKIHLSVGALAGEKWYPKQVVEKQTNHDYISNGFGFLFRVCFLFFLILFFRKSIKSILVTEWKKQIVLLLFVKIGAGALIFFLYQKGLMHSSYEKLFSNFEEGQKIYAYLRLGTLQEFIVFFFKDQSVISSMFSAFGNNEFSQISLEDCLIIKIEVFLNWCFFGIELIKVLFCNLLFVVLLSRILLFQNNGVNRGVYYMCYFPTVLIFTSFGFSVFYWVISSLSVISFLFSYFLNKNRFFLLLALISFFLLVVLNQFVAVIFGCFILNYLIFNFHRYNWKYWLLFSCFASILIISILWMEKIQFIQQDKVNVAIEQSFSNYYHNNSNNSTLTFFISQSIDSIDKFWLFKKVYNPDLIIGIHYLENAIILVLFIVGIIKRRLICLSEKFGIIIFITFLTGILSMDLIEVLEFKVCVLSLLFIIGQFTFLKQKN